MKKIICLVTLYLLAPVAFTQGPLSPSGAPGPTMKTLHQIEPRTPITNLPFIITQPGAYYLAANLTTTGFGISVEADNVSIDLNGFAFSGPGPFTTSSGILICSTGVLQGIVIRNGTIRDFVIGINSCAVSHSLFESLSLYNVFSGIVLDSSNGSVSGNRVQSCQIRCASTSNGNGIIFNTGTGVVFGNQVHDNLIERGRFGIVFDGTASLINGNVVLRNQVLDSSQNAILMRGGYGRIEDNHLFSNSASGFPTPPPGLVTTGSRNFVFNNTMSGSFFGYEISTNDTSGPVVSSAGVLSNTGAAAHPRANFWR